MRYVLFYVLLIYPAYHSYGQTVVEHMQTTNNADVLAMTITGKRDGRPFCHGLRFEVTGLDTAQRDSLYRQALRALDLLGVANVPGLHSSSASADSTARTQSADVTFRCETCSGKGRLEVYGNGYTVTRIIDRRADESHSFPMRIRFVPGNYRLLYYEKHGLTYVRHTESAFTVKADEANTVNVK